MVISKVIYHEYDDSTESRTGEKNEDIMPHLTMKRDRGLDAKRFGAQIFRNSLDCSQESTVESGGSLLPREVAEGILAV
jgi:hypothetical protein